MRGVVLCLSFQAEMARGSIGGLGTKCFLKNCLYREILLAGGDPGVTDYHRTVQKADPVGFTIL